MPDTPPVIAAPIDPAAIRREYLNHETNLRSLGSLYYLGAFGGVVGGAVWIAVPQARIPYHQLIGVLMILLGIAYWKLAAWLRDLDPRARLPANILAVIGLVGFPIGTLISAYILYLLNSKKAAVVFSDEYVLVREATPEIKYKTSKIVIGFVVLLGLFIFIAILAAIFGKH
jgi:hypothetical protein